MIKFLISVSAMLLAFGTFGCSDDNSGGSPAFCTSTETAPAGIAGFEFQGAITGGSGDSLCTDTSTTVAGVFNADTTYSLTVTTTDPECLDSSGTYTYSASTNTGTVMATQVLPEPAEATLKLCVSAVSVIGSDTTYTGTYLLTASDGSTQNGTYSAGLP